ncbi:hypothetical protein [Mesorhizobium sp. ANAO-SY3R2]|uniref:hypothetical protein n=1 Tax=Mesorhizobium sp. ANAO-SY3R2 TaxID=3166644 RepID=UPI00366F96E1
MDMHYAGASVRQNCRWAEQAATLVDQVPFLQHLAGKVSIRTGYAELDKLFALAPAQG